MVGPESAESNALMGHMLDSAERPDYLFRHDWPVGEELIMAPGAIWTPACNQASEIKSEPQRR
jgi:hypothetical protein